MLRFKNFASVFLGQRPISESSALGGGSWTSLLTDKQSGTSTWTASALHKWKQAGSPGRSSLVSNVSSRQQTGSPLTCRVTRIGRRFNRHLLQAPQKLERGRRGSGAAPALNDVTHHHARALKQNLLITQILAESLEQIRCIIKVMKAWITVTQYLSKHQVITILLDNNSVFLLWNRFSLLHRNSPRDRCDISCGGSQGTHIQNNGKWSSARAKDIGLSFTSYVWLLAAVSC